MEQQQSQLHEAQMALVEAQTQARRVHELEKTLAELRTGLATVSKKARDSSLEKGKLTGEAEALRNQVRDLMAGLTSQRHP